MLIDFPSTKESKDLAKRFGYNEFIVRRWINFFGYNETVELIEAMEKGIPKHIRVNTIKIDELELIERLKDRGFILKKTEIPFCYKVLNEPYSIGATPEYLMGYYYVMEKSSCIPPLILNPKLDELVVDFASSPGGKTTFIAQLMKNRGVVLALEAKKERIQPLIDNIHRMGVLNTAVIQMNSVKFCNLNLKVDKILLDAPCSGEGVIHKDRDRKKVNGKRDIEFCSRLQRDLISSALKSLKPGGVLVYSTCTFSPEENEFVIQFALERFDVKVERVKWGEKALAKKFDLDKEIERCRRFYPHKHETSGFFVAKLVKL
ncbi:MAG: SAM-dependent tRNA/rRNA cytosine-C5 methylase [Archaeoglobales archaeon]|nr:MAG: SAM-dependent tRNA/rRNA cytosine-C5 methylase [Archaeoglobales archaeon]